MYGEYWFRLFRLSMMVIGSFASYTKTKSVESAVWCLLTVFFYGGIPFKTEFSLVRIQFESRGRFKLQSACNRIQNNVKSDSKRRAIGFKTADQKIAKFFRRRLVPLHSSTDIWTDLFSLYIYFLTLFRSSTSDLSRINQLKINYTDQESLQHLFLLKTMCEQFKFRYIYIRINSEVLYIF
jgi:hypothetical protein